MKNNTQNGGNESFQGQEESKMVQWFSKYDQISDSILTTALCQSV